MAEIRNEICLTTVAGTVAEIMGIEKSENTNSVLLSLAKEKLGGKKADRAVLYNPDAVALWLYQKYTHLFTDAVISSDIALPVLSVMPSVTPVCFASMYTGVMPEIHGIQKYEKPVLTVNTVFDTFIKAGKKCAIVSTARDSISCIFLEREMDYFIYENVEEVNKKALELIDEDVYDLIVIYNGNYDGTMHKFGPEAKESIDALKHNIAFYKELTDKIKAEWKNHDVLYGFLPDHGCHEIDGECGSHGLDMEEDMNIIHFYGISTKE
ncbi:MAG: alkaline phosphatase family protein [Clostridia bacterium]|nr:alkaline phosphatase family protein [Clostridia bacterium]